MIFIANKFGLKFEVFFFLSLLSALQNQACDHTVMVRSGLWHSKCYTDILIKGLALCTGSCCLWYILTCWESLAPRVIFPRYSPGIQTHSIHSTLMFFNPHVSLLTIKVMPYFYLCCLHGMFYCLHGMFHCLHMMLISISTRTFSAEQFSLGVTSGTSKWQSGYGGVIELLLLAVKCQQRKAQFDCYIPNWVTSSDS